MAEFNPHSILERLRGPGSSLPSRRSASQNQTPKNRTLSTISTNMSSTRDQPGSPGMRQGQGQDGLGPGLGGQGGGGPRRSSSKIETISPFDGGDKSKLGQSHLQPGASGGGGMTYFDQSREKGAAEIREELEAEIQRLRTDLSDSKKENKLLKEEKAILEEELRSLKEKHTDRQSDLRNKLVRQQQKINELSAMATMNAPKNRSSVYNHTANNPLSVTDNQLTLTRQTQYDRNIIATPPSFDEQRIISSKLATNAARTSKDFMAPTFTELMRQSAQKNQAHNNANTPELVIPASAGKKPRNSKKSLASAEGSPGASMVGRMSSADEPIAVGESGEVKGDGGDISTNIQYLESYMEVSGKPKARRNYSYYDDGKGNIQVDLRLI